MVGYWSSGPPPDAPELFAAADRLRLDQIWTAEAYGSDAWTPLAWWGSRTSHVHLGTGISQLSARPPATLAMAAMTMDHLTKGRVIGCRARMPEPDSRRFMITPGAVGRTWAASSVWQPTYGAGSSRGQRDHRGA
jgi:alkanesulfonate monooxygenase SsuD/methylene tetrahydromethanopterin reductase-like flavin-dependent oxidoreductase (luciferase family)